MKKFIFGIIATLVVLALVGLAVAMLGLVSTNADQAPGRLETWLADNAMDASMERHAPRLSNPLPPTDANLIDGMAVYVMNCAQCHGGLDKKASAFGANFYPPAPQLLLGPPDDPEWHLFFDIQHGIRNTGMPSWKGVITENEMWKVTAFLSRLEKLPPAVQEKWKTTIGATEIPATPPEQGEHHGHHE
jgi:thiosulfate dehydrogenase